jgi:serine/threonine protein kinase
MVKVGRGTKARRLLRGLTRSPSRSLAAFRTGSILYASGVPTPRPLAALERTSTGHVSADILLTDWIDAPDLSRLFATVEADERPSLIAGAARSIALLHEAGCRHRDLKASNLLASPTGPEILLADLDGARSCRDGPSHGQRIRDLARFMTSLAVLDRTGEPAGPSTETNIAERGETDRRLFLQRYFEASPDLADNDALRQRWQVRTDAWIRRKVSVNLRNDRPLS